MIRTEVVGDLTDVVLFIDAKMAEADERLYCDAQFSSCKPYTTNKCVHSSLEHVRQRPQNTGIYNIMS